MSKRRGELTVTQASDRLEVHRDTVLRWIKESLTGWGKFAASDVRRDVVGRYYVKIEAVEVVLEDGREMDFR